MFVENKLLYKAKGPVPEEPYIVPLGKAVIRRQGQHVTVVATSIMVVRALEAAQKLALEGIELEVIDLRSLKPYDSDTIIASVKHTGRLLMVHEAPLIGGFGGEIVAMIAQSPAFAFLEAPIVRSAARKCPFDTAPSSNALQSLRSRTLSRPARRLARTEI